MNVNEIREKSRSVIGPYCKSCPVCNGKACSNKIPGPGAKGTGTVAIKNYDAWQKIEVKMDTLAENKEIDTTFKMFGKTFKYPIFAGPVGAVSQHYSDLYNDNERAQFKSVCIDMNDEIAQSAVNDLANYLSRYYGKKVIILLDEYDTPMQEAYVNGYWNELVAFTRSFFNSTFKTNQYLERGIMTGITRVSKESIFSDLNNLKVVTTTSMEYATSFGFTEKEVFEALDDANMPNEKIEVKEWYDGFTFGNIKDIYNPWSITNFLQTGKIHIGRIQVLIV